MENLTSGYWFKKRGKYPLVGTAYVIFKSKICIV